MMERGVRRRKPPKREEMEVKGSGGDL